MIQALSLLKHQGRIISYVIVGIIGKKQQEMIYAQAEKYGVVEQIMLWWYATEEELHALYRHAEVFVYPSFYEWFGFPIIEAMASKTLVITSQTSSMKELVQDSRFLVDPFCVEDIYEKLVFALEMSPDLKQQVIEQHFAFCQQFTWQKSASEYQLIYERLLANDPWN